MPSYNLTPPEIELITNWLFEPEGYLDLAVRASDGQSAKQVLADDPSLDVVQWCRDNTPAGGGFAAISMNESAMFWFIRANDQVNLNPQSAPPELITGLWGQPNWISVLTTQDQSITIGLGKVSQGQRDSKTTNLYGEDGTIVSTIGDGQKLAINQQILRKVLQVFETID